MRERLDRHGTMPLATIVSGHNHYSLAMHIRTADLRLAAEIIAFVREVCA